jgi:hypothetical protein
MGSSKAIWAWLAGFATLILMHLVD